AASAVASSRKNSSVYRPGAITWRCRPLNSSTQMIQRLTANARRIRCCASCRQPRLPMSVPRAGVAISSPNGVTRFWSGIRLSARRQGSALEGLQESLGLQRRHAASAGGRGRLPEGVIGDVAGGKDAGDGGLRGAGHDLDVVVGQELELAAEERGVR